MKYDAVGMICEEEDRFLRMPEVKAVDALMFYVS